MPQNCMFKNIMTFCYIYFNIISLKKKKAGKIEAFAEGRTVTKFSKNFSLHFKKPIKSLPRFARPQTLWHKLPL